MWQTMVERYISWGLAFYFDILIYVWQVWLEPLQCLSIRLDNPLRSMVWSICRKQLINQVVPTTPPFLVYCHQDFIYNFDKIGNHIIPIWGSGMENVILSKYWPILVISIATFGFERQWSGQIAKGVSVV